MKTFQSFEWLYHHHFREDKMISLVSDKGALENRAFICSHGHAS